MRSYVLWGFTFYYWAGREPCSLISVSSTARLAQARSGNSSTSLPSLVGLPPTFRKESLSARLCPPVACSTVRSHCGPGSIQQPTMDSRTEAERSRGGLKCARSSQGLVAGKSNGAPRPPILEGRDAPNRLA